MGREKTLRRMKAVLRDERPMEMLKVRARQRVLSDLLMLRIFFSGAECLSSSLVK